MAIIGIYLRKMPGMNKSKLPAFKGHNVKLIQKQVPLSKTHQISLLFCIFGNESIVRIECQGDTETSPSFESSQNWFVAFASQQVLLRCVWLLTIFKVNAVKLMNCIKSEPLLDEKDP